MSARILLVRAVAVTLGAATAVAAHAQVPTISADDLGRVLGALAAVIESRAREVAADTLRQQLVADLCTHRDTEIQLRKGARRGRLVVRLGGGEACSQGSDDRCDANDVFVRSCRLLSLDEINVTDPHLLQTVGKETVEFAVRVSAFSVEDAGTYAELRLPEVAAYVYDMMAALKGGRLDRHAVVESTAAFADSLGRDLDVALANTALRSVAAHPGTTAAIQQAFTQWRALCPGGAADGDGCRYVALFPQAPSAALDPAGPACTAFDSRASTDERDRMFASLFGGGKPYVAAVERSCSAAASAGAALDLGRCRAAQLGRALDLLYRTKCRRSFDLASLRQALYVLYWQRDVYDDALAPGGVSVLAPLAAAMKPLLSTATSAELTTILKVVTAGVRALDAAPEETRRFLAQLAADVRSTPDRGYNGIFGGDALSWENRLKLAAPVRAFRDQVKQFLAVPVLMVGLDAVPTSDQFKSAASLLGTLFDGLEQLTDEKESPERSILKAANVAASLSAGVRQLRTAIPDATPEQRSVRASLQVFEDAFGVTSEFLTFVANRDWVAIALGVSFQVADIGAKKTKQPQLVHSLAFARMLMSVYQAKRTEEAKAIFASQLESKSSRRERFELWAVDLGAAVGVRWGSQKDSVVDATTKETSWRTSPREMGGLYVPFGVQVTSPYRVGILVSAVDLGAYLTATSGKTSVSAYDAIRPGAALMIRPFRRYPIDLMIAADYRPAIDDQTPQVRYGVSLALELPLYLIK